MRVWNSVEEYVVKNSYTDLKWMFYICHFSRFVGDSSSSGEIGLGRVLCAAILAFVAGRMSLLKTSRTIRSSLICH